MPRKHPQPKTTGSPKFENPKVWEIVVRLAIFGALVAACIVAALWAGTSQEHFGFTPQNLRDVIIILVAYLMLVVRTWRRRRVFILNLTLVMATFGVWWIGLWQMGNTVETWAQWLLLATVLGLVIPTFLPDESRFLWEKV